MKTPENLKKKKLFLFDIDGTLAVGDTLYEGSAELLSYIERIGGKSYFITNNSTKSGLDYVKKFRNAFRLETTEEQFITSGYMTVCFLKKHSGIQGSADCKCPLLRHQSRFALSHRLRLYSRLRCNLRYDYCHHRQKAHISG